MFFWRDIRFSIVMYLRRMKNVSRVKCWIWKNRVLLIFLVSRSHFHSRPFFFQTFTFSLVGCISIKYVWSSVFTHFNIRSVIRNVTFAWVKVLIVVMFYTNTGLPGADGRDGLPGEPGTILLSYFNHEILIVDIFLIN